MLGTMGTKSRGLPRGWSAPVWVVWLACVSLFAWSSNRRTALAAIILSFALGAVMAAEGRTRWVMAAVPTGAFLLTLAYEISGGGQEIDFGPVFSFIIFSVYISVPVIAGVALGALRRLSKPGN